MNPDLTHAVLMQYQTPLPDQTDLGIIRKRVADLNPIFDHYPGLHFKLMVVNDYHSAPISEYSSIYLWHDLQSMASFLTSDRFHSYIDAFARPPVRWWLPQSIIGDFLSLGRAQFVRRQTVGIPRKSNAGTFVSDWTKRAAADGALIQIIAFDPGQWDLVTLTLWEEKPEFQWKSELYAIEHVSVPG